MNDIIIKGRLNVISIVFNQTITQQNSSNPKCTMYNHPYNPYQNAPPYNSYQPAPHYPPPPPYTAPTYPNYNQPQFPHNQFQPYPFPKGQPSLQVQARAGFIRKVYTLLSLQLLVTIVLGYVAYNSPTFQKIFVNLPVIIVLSVALMALTCAMACFHDQFKKCALPFYITFTVIFALLIAISICGFRSKVVLLAAGITFAIVTVLTLYACFTKTDLTGIGPYLLIICFVLLIFGIITIFWRDPIVQLIYSCLSALLFSVYLVFDTQLVLGRFEHQYSLDDAYLAAIQLYIDIMEIFLNILRILNYIEH